MNVHFSMEHFDSHNAFSILESEGYAAIVEHTHDFIEIVYITGGELQHRVCGESIPLRAGDAFVIATGDAHSMAPVSEPADRCTWINVLVRRRALPLLVDDIAPTAVAHPDGDCMRALVTQLMAEWNGRAYAYRDVSMGILLSLSALIRRDVHERSRGQCRLDPQEQRRAYIERAVSYISRNCDRPIRLHDIAAHVGLSEGYLDKLFLEDQRRTPIEYLNICRVARSCQLLLITEDSVARIAESVGFQDIKSYYTAFNRQYGVPPGRYRMLNKRSR